MGMLGSDDYGMIIGSLLQWYWFMLVVRWRWDESAKIDSCCMEDQRQISTRNESATCTTL